MRKDIKLKQLQKQRNSVASSVIVNSQNDIQFSDSHNKEQMTQNKNEDENERKVLAKTGDILMVDETYQRYIDERNNRKIVEQFLSQ